MTTNNTVPDPLPDARRTFRQALANTLVASVVNSTVWFAVTFFVYLETRSVFATGIVAGVFLAFTSLSGVWFGSLVDHHRKRTVMIGSSLASLAFYGAALALQVAVDPAEFRDAASPVLWSYVLLLMCGVIIGNLRAIALSTVVTLLVPADDRDRANGQVGTVNGVSFLVTSVISGVMVGTTGMASVLVLAVVATTAAIGHLLFLTIPEQLPARAEGEPGRVDLRGTIALVTATPGLAALIAFSTINNFLGGVLMALCDAYGLSLMSVQAWGVLFGFLSAGFIIGGLVVARRGLGRSPLRTLLLANAAMWTITALFTVQSSVVLLAVGMLGYMCLIPCAEAAEQTVLQKVVPYERQGRVFGFAQSVEQAASPLTAFLISPIAQFVFIPFMTTGAGAELLGPWYGVGPERGLALLFSISGLLGLVLTLVALRSRHYRRLSRHYRDTPAAAPEAAPAPCLATV